MSKHRASSSFVPVATPRFRVAIAGLFCAASGLLLAACGDGTPGGVADMKPPPLPLPVCSALMPPGAQPSSPAAADAPPAMARSGACTEVTTGLAREPAPADIVPAGYRALGPAIHFSPGGAAPKSFPHGIDFVVPCDLRLAPAGASPSSVVVVEKRPNGAVVVTPAPDMVVEAEWNRLHFHGDELATYQAAIPETAGETVMRHYTWRALSGVSMGGIGSSVNFWTHPERYDALAVMGADPGPDLTYTLGILHDWFFGGFCTADDEKAGKGKIGQLCPATRKPMLDQTEVSFDFEHLYYQVGDGVGLTLRRSLYIRAFRDLARAFGNGAYPSAAGQSPYLPPGIPKETLALANTDACDPKSAKHPKPLLHFYDRRYNPGGAFPVITFCDGGDGTAKGYGVFDPSQPQNDPTQIMLAVDVNGNGVRDSGEPVLLQAAEPWDDVGVDGLPDAKEPGYDPVTNPDPNHDDYHWLHNPTGTEGNWRWDPGEPYEDTGVDGVKGSGCEVGKGQECYDYGEGNGKFDYAPNAANWYAHDPRTLLEKLDPAMLQRLDVYYDAGIHDFLNAQVSTNSLMAALHGRGQHVRVWDGFPLMVGQRPSAETQFDVNALDFASLGRHLYVRYGDPDASESVVEMTGDGRHVGTILQAAHRAQMLFSFLSHVWPDGDVDVAGDLSGGDPIDAMFTTSFGRKTPYTVVPPPGYTAPSNAQKRYPVVYLMHGYGMHAKDLGQVSVIAQSAMVNDHVPASRRMQKMIIVSVDGACYPGGGVSSQPLPPDGDLCEEGTFYTDHPEGTAKMQAMLLELEKEVESKYRVRQPEDRPFRP